MRTAVDDLMTKNFRSVKCTLGRITIYLSKTQSYTLCSIADQTFVVDPRGKITFLDRVEFDIIMDRLKRKLKDSKA